MIGEFVGETYQDHEHNPTNYWSNFGAIALQAHTKAVAIVPGKKKQFYVQRLGLPALLTLSKVNPLVLRKKYSSRQS